MGIREAFDSFRAARIAGFMRKHIHPRQRVLDFGAGSLTVARAVQRLLKARVIGVDVLPADAGPLPFSVYGGKRLPFHDGAFDASYLAFVLHHSARPARAMRECLRVTAGRVIVMEDVYRTRFERAWLELFDWLGNRPYSEGMSLPYNFRKDGQWRRMIEDLGARLLEVSSIRPNPWRPTAHRMYVIEKARRAEADAPARASR